MKINNITLLILALAAFILTSCEDVIDVDTGETRDLLVVEGAVQTHTDTQFVKLSRTTDYFNDLLPDYEIEREAEVRLFEDDILIGNMNYNSSRNQFEIVYPASVGSHYHIEITSASGEEYRSEPEELRTSGEPDSIYYEYNDSTAFFGENYTVLLDAQELEGPGDSYQWKVYINGEYQSRAQDLAFASDELVEGNYISGAQLFILSPESYDYHLSRYGEVEVTVHQLGITRRYFRFLMRMQEQTFVGSPFDTPPAEIRGNVNHIEDREKRALGYFYAADVYIGKSFTID